MMKEQILQDIYGSTKKKKKDKCYEEPPISHMQKYGPDSDNYNFEKYGKNCSEFLKRFEQLPVAFKNLTLKEKIVHFRRI